MSNGFESTSVIAGGYSLQALARQEAGDDSYGRTEKYVQDLSAIFAGTGICRVAFLKMGSQVDFRGGS